MRLSKLNTELLPAKFAVKHRFADYPAALQPALNLLAHYHPQAEQVAERILAEIKPSVAKLEQECEYLQLKLASCTDDVLVDCLKQRLANLQVRLEQPNAAKPVSEKRLARLVLKLQHASLHAFFTAWEQSNLQALQAQLHQAFNLEELPVEWLTDKEKLDALLALSALEQSERRVVGLLCQAQIQQAYPLTTAPANQAWLQKMQAKGLNLQPWLTGIELSSELALEGKTIQVQMRFAQTIFEVFRMGDHFQTCLSRGGCNFFSVVANAADINKRVLYFFDKEGAVLGRCLLAISDQGQLLRFYIYSHLPDKVLDACVQLFVAELARQMNIRLGSAGSITKLVAAHWYDDGVETLKLDSDELALFANLRPKLAGLKADKLFKTVQAAVAPQPVSELLILSLFHWDELRAYFDLRLEFALECRRQRLLSEYGLHEIVRSLLAAINSKADSAEKMAAIWSLAQTWLWDHLQEDIVNTGSFNPDEMNLLIQHQPWQALRLFRVSKRRIERRTDVYFRQRMDFYHAKTLIAVQRWQQAQKLIKQLEAEGYNDGDLVELRRACEESLQVEV